MDEQASEMLAAALGDAHKDRLVSARELSRHEADPGSEMAAVFELRPIADCRNNCGSCLRPDTLYRRNALARLALPKDPVDLLIEGRDPAIEIPEEIVKFRNRLAGEWCQFVLMIGQDLRDRSARPCDRLGEGKSTIQQETPDLAHDGCPVIYHALSGAMQCLNVLLLNRFLGNEGNVGLPGCGADRLSIIAVVLLSAHKRLHVLRADDFYLVPERFEFPCPVKRARACFHDNDTGRNPGHDIKQLIAHHAPFQNSATIPIDAVQLENLLGDIDTNHMDGHWASPSQQALSLRLGGESRPSH
jgi:hypothetical protein